MWDTALVPAPHNGFGWAKARFLRLNRLPRVGIYLHAINAIDSTLAFLTLKERIGTMKKGFPETILSPGVNQKE